MPASLLLLLALALAPLAALAQTREFRDCRDCPVMVALPPGTFTMGAEPGEGAAQALTPDLRSRSEPPTRITLTRGFAIGKFPVTRAEFLAFARATNRAQGPSCWGLAPQPDGSGRWQERQRLTWTSPGFGQTPLDPIVCVNWADAVAYADWLSRRTGRRYRLPSEAEWEYAARAGTTGPHYWTGEPAETCRHANVRDQSVAAFHRAPRDASFFPCSDGFVHTARVGAFPANAFGLHDMLGNVWQWAQDCWNPTLQGQPRLGTARETGDCLTRVARGGSWSNDPRFLRASHRGSGAATVRSSNTGFRLARSE